jgi:hypothetical protein
MLNLHTYLKWHFKQFKEINTEEILPPRYPEGANITQITDVEDFRVREENNDTWNHSNDGGQFEARMQDLEDQVTI